VLIQAIRYSFAPEAADEAEQIFRELRDASLTEPGVIRFDVARSREDPSVFALWEEYVDEAALEAHMASHHFQRLAVRGVRPLAKTRLAEKVFPIE
jgi:quinol monooxygenase YgiN